MKRLLLSTITLCASCGLALAQTAPIDFEGRAVPSNVEASRGKVSISTDHRVLGESSLRWDFAPNDTLTIRTEVGYRPQEVIKTMLLGKEYEELGESVGFYLPIYSPRRQEAQMRIAFGREGMIDCYTDVLLDYDHWFRFQMLYDRAQMTGAPRTDMTQLQIINKSQSEGTIYLDNLITAKVIDQRQIEASYLIPDNTWQNERRGAFGEVTGDEDYLNRAWFPLAAMNAQEEAAFQTIEDRLLELEWGGRQKVKSLAKKQMEQLRKKYEAYHISVKGGIINGDHVTGNGAYNALIKNIGQSYYRTKSKSQRRELAQMGVNMIWHAAEVADVKINWYNGRGLADGCYLLREELLKAGVYDKALAHLRDAYRFSEVYDERRSKGMEGGKGLGSDDFYTNTISKIVCVLMVRDDAERVRDMRHFISYYNNVAFQYAPGLHDTFKPDGSHFHHANAYPDRYSHYTLPTVCELLRIMSNTTFSFSAEAHNLVRENAKLRAFYRSQHHFPWAYAHNLVRVTSTENNPEEFVHLAYCGSVDGKESLDREMAAIYLQQMAGMPVNEDMQAFMDAGVEPAELPQGNHTMSYYAKGLHRWSDWLSVVGAHSRYIYASENWKGRGDGRGDLSTNRFVNWGQLELIKPDRADMKYVNNGWDLDGWDFTRIPGTTTVKAPLDSMRTVVMKHGDDLDEHLRSDQPFVGGLDFSDGMGIFVMKLRGHDKYNLESFYATKSYFMFGGNILCLGSDIRNQLPYYTTQTTLFQNASKYNPMAMTLNGEKLSASHFEQTLDSEKSNWIIDSREVGYYLPKGEKLHLSYAEQTSTNDHGMGELKGEFESAWFDHGNAPESASYEYLIKLSATPEQMEELSAAPQKIYRVVQADKRAHIVEMDETNTCAMVLYEKNYDLNQGVVKGVTHSSLVVTKQEGKSLRLAVADPDLRLYEGFSADVDLFGVRHEQPAYSHYWYSHDSKPSKILVFLNGDWDISEIVSRNGRIVQRANDVTVVEFECQHGLTNEIVLDRL